MLRYTGMPLPMPTGSRGPAGGVTLTVPLNVTVCIPSVTLAGLADTVIEVVASCAETTDGTSRSGRVGTGYRGDAEGVSAGLHAGRDEAEVAVRVGRRRTGFEVRAGEVHWHVGDAHGTYRPAQSRSACR